MNKSVCAIGMETRATKGKREKFGMSNTKGSPLVSTVENSSENQGGSFN